ncbi:MAG TPA: hypothetical protein VMH27_11785 [Puia sp.]|nr:hypothetical protein [Puia sp.]
MKTLKRGYPVVYLVLAAAVLYLAFLTTIAHHGVFYSADGGVKFITVKQVSEGYGYKYLRLVQPRWVQSIWQAGFFPLRPPFVYPSSGGYVSVFPPAFQVASAWLYSWMGYRGLYVLPILSMLLIWVFTVLLLRRLGISPARIALALFIMTFCSPLTIYGAMFWEHGPATLLLLAGLFVIVRPPARPGAALALGLASGMAIWLRPEAIMLDFLYGLAVLVLYRRERRAIYLAFAAGVLAALTAFLVFNQFEYGNIMGLHGQQLVDPNDADDHLGFRKSLYVLLMTNYKQFRHFGFTLLLFPILYRLFRMRKQRAASGEQGQSPPDDPRPALLGTIVVVFSLVTPFFLPNDGGRQWGVRYFLPLIPIVIVFLFLIDQQWGILAGRYRIAGWGIAGVLLIAAYSFFHNTISGGAKNLEWAYRGRVLPTMERFEKNDGSVIVVSDPYMVYELGWLFDRDYFFLATGDANLRRLLPMLKANGVREYTYIFNPRNPASQPESLRDSATQGLWPLAAERKIIEEFYCTKYRIE